MIVISVLVAISASVLGHVGANVLPGPLTEAFGLPVTESVRTSGAIVVAAAFQLVAAVLFGAERGLIPDRLRRRGMLAEVQSS
jgi:hypothetical protein